MWRFTTRETRQTTFHEREIRTFIRTKYIELKNLFSTYSFLKSVFTVIIQTGEKWQRQEKDVIIVLTKDDDDFSDERKRRVPRAADTVQRIGRNQTEFTQIYGKFFNVFFHSDCTNYTRNHDMLI